MNIRAVAERTGVGAATLRKWEQRYGVLKPERTAGAHRRYSERDVLRVEWLTARLSEGYRIGAAAALLGRAEVPPAMTKPDLATELVAAAAAADPERIQRALDQAFALHPVDEALVEIIEPALREVGELWARGSVTVGHEHHVSELVRKRLSALVEGTVGTRGTVVLCCVPGERHELGLLATSVLLHADGWQVCYLGADTPLEYAGMLADTFGARALCVSATMAEHASAADADLDALARRYPDLIVLRGGAGFGDGHAREAVTRLRGSDGSPTL